MILTSYAKSQIRIAKALEWDGIDEQCVIIDKWTEDDIEWGNSYFIGYRFSYMGETWVGKHHVNSSSTYNRAQLGVSVTVRFLPLDPTISKLSELETNYP